MATTFPWRAGFQNLLIACLIDQSDEFSYLARELKPNYFVGAQSTLIARCLIDYQAAQDRYPTWTVLRELAARAVDSIPGDRDPEALMIFIDELKAMDTGDWRFVRENLGKFIKERAVNAALQKAVKYLQEDKIPDGGLAPLFDEAARAGQNLDDLGFVFHADVDRVVDLVTGGNYGTASGFPLLDKIWRNGWGPGWLVVPLAPPKRYKCESPDTEILMFDGSVKKICEVVPGDEVMGDDSAPRTVLSCGRGSGPMYRVTQANGDNYTVTHDHVLCVKRLAGTVPVGRFNDRYHADQIQEITAEEYSRSPEWFKRTWKGYKVGVTFPRSEVPLDPYFLGLWLGDGTADAPSITVGDDDPEIERYLTRFAADSGTGISRYPNKSRCAQIGLTRKGCAENPITSTLRALNVIKNKHVPSTYKINSRETRLSVLAGLIDSDGNHTKNRGFIFVNTNRQLCDDTCWVARSLGFKSYVRKVRSTCTVQGKKIIGQAYRTYIQGKISEIPTKLPRKRGVDSAKASDRTTIKVEPVGHRDWFGIEIDGNRRYLHSDFTVTHNTGFCINVACNIISPQTEGDVLYYACEISQELAMCRALCNISGLNSDYMFDSPEKFRELVNARVKETVAGNLVFKSFSAKAASILDIRQHAKAAVAQLGLKNLKAIVIDYAETVKGDSDKGDPEYRKSAAVYTGARALGAEFGCPVLMPDRCNRETTDKPVPNMTSFQGAMEKAGIVDVAFGLCSTDEEHRGNILRLFNFINRHGPGGQHLRGRVDPMSWRMEFNEEVAYAEQKQMQEDAEETKRGRGARGSRSKVPSELTEQ